MCICDDTLWLYHAIMWINELQLENADFEMDSNKVVDYFTTGNTNIKS